MGAEVDISVVTGTVVDREVITIKYGSNMMFLSWIDVRHVRLIEPIQYLPAA